MIALLVPLRRSRLVVVTVVVFGILAAGVHSAAAGDADLMTFTAREGDEQVRFVFDAGTAPVTGDDGSIRLPGAIVDFSLPFNATNGRLERATLGGDEAVNQVEVRDQPGDGTALILFRLTTAGTGGGEGKSGASIVAGFVLAGDVFAPQAAKALRTASSGTLHASIPECRTVQAQIEPDLKSVGADSRPYVLTFQPSDFACSLFHGFAVFDPTKPGSKSEAYFEAQQSEAAEAWSLEAK